VPNKVLVKLIGNWKEKFPHQGIGEETLKVPWPAKISESQFKNPFWKNPFNRS